MEGMTREELDHFRKLLLEERKRVLEELDWVETNYIGRSRRDSAGDVSSYSMHPADMGTDSNEMEKAYMIGAASGAVLEDIDECLRNLDKGGYGRCVECEQPISRERLEGVPYAKRCIACKTKLEGSGGATR
jgi:RNA polymerase-binding transcription factor DksA